MRKIKMLVSSFLLVVLVLLPIQAASATSPYDHIVTPVQDLFIHNGINNNCTADFTDTWVSEFREGLSGGDLRSFDARAAWAVVLVESDEGGGSNYYRAGLQIYWWEDDELPAEAYFDDIGGFSYVMVDAPHVGSIAYNNWRYCQFFSVVPQLPYVTPMEVAGSRPGVRYSPYQTYGVSFSLPLGYEGLGLPSMGGSTDPRYVALGDSYSAGEGVEDFEIGTDPGCHRSIAAYPRILQSDLSLGLGHAKFAACTGATTENILYSGQNGEPAQIEALTENTEVVTLSVGGNDVAFASYVTGCVWPGYCGPNSIVYDAMMDGIEAPAFKSNLVSVYEEVLSEAPNAQVYVVDYPYVSLSYSAYDPNTDCGGLNLAGTREVQEALNSVIKDAVEVEVNDSRLHLVETNYSGSPFVGKELCGNDGSVFHGLTTPLGYSVHPKETGQELLAQIVKAHIQ
jgi:lysophospholipase L1-like esterase